MLLRIFLSNLHVACVICIEGNFSTFIELKNSFMYSYLCSMGSVEFLGC